MVEFSADFRYNYTITHRAELGHGPSGHETKERIMKFHIVSDSSCDLGRAGLERIGVSMV